MFVKFVYIFMLALILSAAGVYMSRHHQLEAENTAQTFRQNANLLGRYAAAYAGAHDTATGGVSPATVGVPSWYTPYPGIRAYVNSGSAYVYYSATSNPSPAEALTYVAGPGITAGIMASGAIRDGTGRSLPTSVQVPSGIPDGAMVLVSRDVMPTVPHAAPGLSTQGAPGSLPPGAPLGGPETFPGFTSVPVPWTPVSPPWVNPPNSTIAAQPPPPPTPPPSIPSFTIGIHGGYMYEEGRKAGLGTCTLSPFNTFVNWSASIGNPASSYAITMTRAGHTVSVTLPSSAIQCAVSCAGNGSIMSDAQALAFTPDISWSSLVYLKAVTNSSGGVTITDYPEDMTVSLKACNANGCSTTNESSQALRIFSQGKRDCQAATGNPGPWPATAYP